MAQRPSDQLLTCATGFFSAETQASNQPDRLTGATKRPLQVDSGARLGYESATMLDAARIYFFVFALLTIAGGIIGYVKAGSVISVVAGFITGILLGVAGYILPLHREPGLGLGFFTSLLLAIQFIPRVFRTRRLVPGGIMSILSVIGIVIAVAAWVSK